MTPDAHARPADVLGQSPAAGVRQLAQALRLDLGPESEKLLAEQLRAILLDFQASAGNIEAPAAVPVVLAATAALRADQVQPSNLAGPILAGAHRREGEYFLAGESIPAAAAGGERQS